MDPEQDDSGCLCFLILCFLFPGAVAGMFLLCALPWWIYAIAGVVVIVLLVAASRE